MDPVYTADQSSSVSVSATIGQNEVTVNGYTSPNSRVELTGINIYSLGYSDSTGYFEFKNIVLPKNLSELCLQSQDGSSLSSSLHCIPSPPAVNYHTDIGPILLPPTISLEESQITPNATVISSGQSIPKSTVTVFFYKVDDSAKSFPKQVSAYSLPKIETTTDENGSYSITIPTAYSSDYRFYTSTKFIDNFSPKSNTLLYSMPKNTSYLIFLIPTFIFSLIIFFIVLFLNSHPKKRFLPAIPFKPLYTK
jgi:hypothetical protein